MRSSVTLRLLALLGLSVCIFYSCADKDTSVVEPDVDPPWFPSVSESGGRITWMTNEASSCVLLYGSHQGTYDHYGYHVDDGRTGHHVDLIDVEPGTYYVRIIATDQAGNTSTSEEMIFDVADVPATENLVYTMVDVGWGDCHFLEFPGGTNVMVDAGAGNGEYRHLDDVNDFLKARGIDDLRPSGIDYMVGTHHHEDHYTGFLGLIPVYNNTTFLAPAEPFEDLWRSVGATLTSWDVPRDSLRAGQTNETTDLLKWDEEHGVKVKVLSAGAGRFYDSAEEDDERVNCDSVVLKLIYGRVHIMLNADAEDFVEQRMLKALGDELDCDVLKVGHHANNDATSREFLEIATPRVGLIPNSMAENDGVFSQAVINLLRDYRVDYYVSDRAYRNAGRYDEVRDGHVTVTTDGETFVVWTWR